MSETVSFSSALVSALAAMEDVRKDATAKAGSYQYSYATLPAVLGMARPILAQHGLALTFESKLDQGDLSVAAVLLHTSGERLMCGPFTVRANGDMQAMGSQSSYLRRYLALSILGIAPDDDDDGQAVAGTPVHRQAEPSAVSSDGVRTTLRGPAAAHDASTPPSPKAVAFAKSLATSAGLDQSTIGDYYSKFVANGATFPGWDGLGKAAVSALIDSLKEEVAKQGAKIERVSYVPQAGRDYTPPGNESDDPWMTPPEPPADMEF